MLQRDDAEVQRSRAQKPPPVNWATSRRRTMLRYAIFITSRRSDHVFRMIGQILPPLSSPPNSCVRRPAYPRRRHL